MLFSVSRPLPPQSVETGMLYAKFGLFCLMDVRFEFELKDRIFDKLECTIFPNI